MELFNNLIFQKALFNLPAQYIKSRYEFLILLHLQADSILYFIGLLTLFIMKVPILTITIETGSNKP